MKGSQPKKLAADALKLITVREALLPGARLVLAVADPVVAEQIRRSWLGAALELWTVHLQVVELPSRVARVCCAPGDRACPPRGRAAPARDR